MKTIIFSGLVYAAVLWVMYAAFQRWKRRTQQKINPQDLRVGQRIYYYSGRELRAARVVNNLRESEAVYARKIYGGKIVRIEYKHISKLV